MTAAEKKITYVETEVSKPCAPYYKITISRGYDAKDNNDFDI